MLDTVVISGDDMCCSLGFGTLVGVFVFSVMLFEANLRVDFYPFVLCTYIYIYVYVSYVL